MMRVRRRSRRGAGGVGAGRAQVGQREEGATSVISPLGPPAVWMVLLNPLHLLVWLLTGRRERAVGRLVDSGTGRHPVMMPTVPVRGSAAGERGRS